MAGLDAVLVLDYPFPYKAALAICNDIDYMPYQSLISLFQFMCGDRDEGGLGLEFSTSVFFFNNHDIDQHFSYFIGASLEPSAQAPALREMIAAGYIDAIHAYGTFNNGSFSRQFAEKVRDELARYDLHMPIWSNHGNCCNLQGIGGRQFNYHQQGDVYESDYYHRDLLDQIGVRYYCICSSFTDHFVSHWRADLAKPRKRPLGTWKLAWPWRRRGVGKMPLNPFWPVDSPVLYNIQAADGVCIQGFHRYRGLETMPGGPDLGCLPRQVTAEKIEQLVEKGGVCVLYQHLATLERVPRRVVLASPLNIPPASRETLSYLAAQHHGGRVWVPGLSRLLDYLVMRNEVTVRPRYREAGREATLEVSLKHDRSLTFGCQGLSVAIPGEVRAAWFNFQGQKIKGELLEDSESGTCVVRWPITPLPSLDFRKFV